MRLIHEETVRPPLIGRSGFATKRAEFEAVQDEAAEDVAGAPGEAFREVYEDRPATIHDSEGVGGAHGVPEEALRGH